MKKKRSRHRIIQPICKKSKQGFKLQTTAIKPQPRTYQSLNMSESLFEWMRRSRYEYHDIAKVIFIDQQTLKVKLKNDSWTDFEIETLKRLITN